MQSMFRRRLNCRTNLRRFEQLASVVISRGAIDLIVLARYRFRSTFCTCGLPSGSSPEKFFENTRDYGSGELKMVSARLPKNFR
jgi:hypothetical protein